MYLMLAEQVQHAELTTGLIIASIAISALSYVLRKKPNTDFKVDTTLTTLTTRGAYAPLLVGRQPVAPVFAWAGDRVIEESSVGGGKGLGGGGASQFNYFENGVHILAVGPVDALLEIRDAGKVIWKGPIDRFSTPSGSAVTTDVGTFKIYWGEEKQPINTDLADPSRLGISSRWPYTCYIYWIKCSLGTSPRWPQREYLIEANAVGSTLSRSPAIIPQESETYQDTGVNAAHTIYQITTGRPPHGAGMSPDLFDFGSLESLGVVFDTERLATSLIVRDGRTCGDVLAELMQEMGFVLSQVGDRLVFVPLRHQTDAPTFTENQLSGSKVEETSEQGDTDTNRTTYLFNDKTKRFRPSDLTAPDDAEARARGARNSVDVSLTTVTDRVTAQKVAERRQLEETVSQSVYKIGVGATGRALIPGQACVLPTIGPARVVSRKMNTDRSLADLSVIRDVYGVVANGWVGGDASPPVAPASPVPDAVLAMFEVPYEVAGDAVKVAALRIRGNASSGSASIHLSSDDSAYRKIGDQPLWSRGGTLRTPLYEGGLTIEEMSALISPFNEDIRQALDLSESEDRWLSGDQIALIGDEVCFLRRLSPEGADYRMIGLVRGRSGTVQRTHPAGTSVYIANRQALKLLTNSTLFSGTTRYFKSQVETTSIELAPKAILNVRGIAKASYPAYNLATVRGPSHSNDAVLARDVAEGWLTLGISDETRYPRGRQFFAMGRLLTVKSVVQEGDQIKVYPYESLAGTTASGIAAPTEDSYDSYAPGQDTTIVWSIARRDVPSVAAGQALDLPDQSPEGDFVVKVGSRVLGAYSTPRAIYTEAMRTEDFGTSTPAVFTVSITSRFGGISAWTVSKRFVKGE